MGLRAWISRLFRRQTESAFGRSDIDWRARMVALRSGARSGVDQSFLRANVATIVRIALAPPSPENARIITAELGNNTTLRWSEGSGGAIAPKTDHYELVWRATTDATWTHAQDVGHSTEVTIDTSKDDHFFGVRSVSADGHKSIVSFAWQAKK